MRNTYTEEQKAAVLASLIAGNTYAYVAEQYGIPEGTIKAWKAERDGSRSAVVITEKQEALKSLMMGLLEQELITLQGIARQVMNRDWLEKQKASEVAILYGVIFDKAMRKIEAWSGGDNSEDTKTEN